MPKKNTYTAYCLVSVYIECDIKVREYNEDAAIDAATNQAAERVRKLFAAHGRKYGLSAIDPNPGSGYCDIDVQDLWEEEPQ